MPAILGQTGVCLQYNGVSLQDCQIEEWVNTCLYDESQNRTWSKVRITVSSMIMSNFASPHVPGTTEFLDATGSKANRAHKSQSLDVGTYNAQHFLATDYAANQQDLLMTPRRDLVVYVNNATQPMGVDEIEHRKERTSHRRILIAACGTPSKADYTFQGGNYNSNDLQIFDPQASNFVNTIKIKRKDVLDCDGGPKPINVSLVPIAGSKAFRITFTIEITRNIRLRWFSPDSSSNTTSTQYAKRYLAGTADAKWRPIISCTWSAHDMLDGDGRVTHTISGKVIVADSRYKPNAMRYCAFPMAFPFAKTASRKYTVSEDGKTLAFEISHTTAGAAPPEFVRDYQAVYSERFSKEIKAKLIGEMNVKVKGWFHRTDDQGAAISEKLQKAVLLRQAMVIVYSRIRFMIHQNVVIPGMIANKEVDLLDLQVIEQVGVPELDVRIKVMRASAEGDGIRDIWLRLEKMGDKFDSPWKQGVQNIPVYDSRWWPIDNIWGRSLKWDNANDANDVKKGGHPAYASNHNIDNNDDFREYADYFDTYSLGSEENHTFGVPMKTRKPEPWKVWTDGNDGVLTDPGSIDGITDEAGISQYTTVNPTYDQNPIYQSYSLNAYVTPNLDGLPIAVTALPRPIYHTDVFASEQATGLVTYISYTTECLSDASTGKIAMPLSKPRVIKGGQFVVSSGSQSLLQPLETSTVVRLFAGSSKHVVSIKAERLNDWPKMPEPAEIVFQYGFPNGPPSDPSAGPERVGYLELVKKEIIDDSPQPFRSGNGLVFTTNLRLTYAVSKPWFPTEQQQGYISPNELFPLAMNKMLQSNAQVAKLTQPTRSRFEPHAQGQYWVV